jgi:hypothetical protein
LLVGASSEAEQAAAFSAVDPAERARVPQHQARFRQHTRDPQRAAQQLERVQQAWLALPGTPLGDFCAIDRV